MQNFGVGGNANVSNPNFNLNDNFPGMNSTVNQEPMLSAESVSYSHTNDLSDNGQRNKPQTQRDKRSNIRNTAKTAFGVPGNRRKQQHNEAAVTSASRKRQNEDYSNVDFGASAISTTQQRLLDEHRQRQAQDRRKQSSAHGGQEMKRRGQMVSEKSSKEFISNNSKKNLVSNNRGNKRVGKNNNRSRLIVTGVKDHKGINDQQAYGTKNGDSQYNNLQYDDDDDEEDDEEEDSVDEESRDGGGAFVGGANDATNTLRKRNVRNNKSKSRSKNKSSKIQNLDRHQCRSMTMKTCPHFCGKTFQTENEAYHPACTT